MPFGKVHGWWFCIGPTILFAASATSSSVAGPEDVASTKPAITGFIDMQTIAWHNTDDSTPSFTLDNVNQFPGVFGGIVLNATWAEMQDKPGGELVTARIDRA